MEDPLSGNALDADSKETVKQLRMLVHASAISLLILTGTIFIYLYRQVSSVQKNTRELANYIVEYEGSNASEFIAEIHRKFAAFRKEHPDFAPVYSRYFGTNEPPPRAAANGVTNPPAKVVPAPGR